MAERVEIIIEGQDRLSGPARTATSSLSSLERAAGTGAAGIGRLDTASRSAEASVGGLGTVMRGAAGTALGFAALGALSGVISGFAGSFIGMNTQLETAEMQFTTLLGSADLARERIAELYKFAAVTPFEFQDVLQASRALEMAGGAALATGKSLTMVGDAAAATGAPFQEVAMWTARMYSAMQAGRPFGEAAQRLQELMILAPDVRNELEALQKSGADGAKLWDVYTKAMGRYNGAMANLAGTFTGMLTTISDSINMALGALGKPLFNVLKMGMQPSIDFLSGPVSDAFTRLGERAEIGVAGIGAAFGGIGRLIEQMLGGPIGDAFGWGYDLMQAYADGIMDGASSLIGGVASFVGDLIGSWFEAFSPPRILPDIDQWGAATMEAYLKGFEKADFGVFKNLGNVIESQLKSMVKLGQLPEEGLVPAIIGRRTALAQAITLMRTGQAVSQGLLDSLTEGFGRSADAVKAYLTAEMAVIPATRAVESAQDRLTAAQRRLSEMRRQRVTGGALESAQAEVEAAQDNLQLARDQENSLKNQADLAKNLVDAMSDNKSLQVQMVEALNKAADAAGKVGDNISKGVSKATAEAKEKIISEFELAKKGVQERVAAFFDPLTTQAAKIGEKLRAALGNIGITPEQITGVANALGRITGIALTGRGAMIAWGVAAGVLGIAIGGLSGIIGMLTSPFALAAAAAAAWQTNLGGVQERLKTLFAALEAGDLSGAFDVVSAAIGELVAWIGEQAAPIIDQLGKWTDAFLAWAEKVLPPLMDKVGTWAAAFVAWIGPMIPPFLARLGELTGKLLAWLGEQTGRILGKLGEWAMAFWAWIEPMIPPFIAKIGDLASALLAWIVAAIPPLAEKLGEWALAFVRWVAPMIPKAIGALLLLVGAIMDWITKEGPPLAERILSEWLPALIGWVAKVAIAIIPELVKLLGVIGVWILTQGGPKLLIFAWEMGKAIIKGLLQGLANLGVELGKALQDALEGVVNAISFDLGPFHMANGVFWVSWPEIPNPFAGMAMATATAAEMAPPGELQRGGPVFPGRPYLVGEAGPELFAPRGAGIIIPNNALRNDNRQDNREVTVNIYGGGDAQSVIDRFAADPRVKDYLKPRARF